MVWGLGFRGFRELYNNRLTNSSAATGFPTFSGATPPIINIVIIMFVGVIVVIITLVVVIDIVIVLVIMSVIVITGFVFLFLLVLF